MAEKNQEQQGVEEEKSSQPSEKPSKKPEDPPEVIAIDMTPETYEQMKKNILAKQHPVVRPHIHEFFRWLEGLDALDVFDALEQKHTVKDKYDQMGFNPIRISIAAARGILKASPNLQKKALRAFNVEVARVVLRFDNPAVWQVLKECDPKENYLRDNVDAAKEIFGLAEKRAA